MTKLYNAVVTGSVKKHFPLLFKKNFNLNTFGAFIYGNLGQNIKKIFFFEFIFRRFLERR